MNPVDTASTNSKAATYHLDVTFPYIKADATLLDDPDKLTDVIYWSQEAISSRLVSDVLEAHENAGLPLSCFISAIMKHLKPHAKSEKARNSLESLDGFYDAVLEVDGGFKPGIVKTSPTQPIKKDELLEQISSELLTICGLAKAGLQCTSESSEDEAVSTVYHVITQRSMEAYNRIDEARLEID